MPEDVTLHPWLTQFTPAARSLVESWFMACASQHPRDAEVLLKPVERLAMQKLAWSTTPTSREACVQMLIALKYHRGEALCYARTWLTEAC